MKFDFIIGNPPYQEETQNEGDRANPIYDKFIDGSYQLSDAVELIHPARFLFNAGQTSKKWNERMLNDNHLKIESYYPDASIIFPNTLIKGGVVITYHTNNEEYKPIKKFVSEPTMNSILHKVLNKNSKSMDEIVSSRGMYRFSKSFYAQFPKASEIMAEGTGNMVVSNIMETLPAIFSEKQSEDKLAVYGRLKNTRIKKYILSNYIEDNEYLTSYNVVIAESNGTGAFGETLSSPFVIKPNEITTDSFISVGLFKNKQEALNELKYLKTKFARALLDINKPTQHTAKKVWCDVPLQDFTSSSDIDWTKSIHEIDEQLYEKYGLTEAERDFIETHVKAME